MNDTDRTCEVCKRPGDDKNIKTRTFRLPKPVGNMTSRSELCDECFETMSELFKKTI